MEAKLEKIAQRVEELLATLKTTRQEADSLKAENVRLKDELVQAEKEFRRAQLSDSDRHDDTRAKLARVLDRLTELEKLTR